MTAPTNSAAGLARTARWRWPQPIAGHVLLLLLLSSNFFAASAMIIEPSAGGFAVMSEPPANFLISSPAATSVNCGPLVQDASLRLRWRYEVIDRSAAGDADRAAFGATSAYVSENASAASSGVGPPFYDAGNGQLVFPSGTSDTDFLAKGLPKYKLYCEARNSGSAIVSRPMLPKKVSTLRTCKPVLNCFSGPLNGSAVCRLHTDPHLARLSDHFSIDYFREPVTADQRCGNSGQERLVFNSRRPKYAAFNADQGHLHVMSLSEADTRYCYRARISLRDPAAGREVYWNMSEPRHVRIISPIDGPQDSRSELAAYSFEDGLSVQLLCYANEASSAAGGGGGGGGGVYSWRKDGAPLTVGPAADEEDGDGRRPRQKYSFLNVNSGNLRLRVDGRSDSGLYTCAYNERSVLTVELQFYKPLKAQLPAPQVSADHNSSLSLNCTVTGWPISRILWLRNGVRLPDGDSRCRVETDIDAGGGGGEGEGESTGRLLISGVGLSDQGAYQCVAERDSVVAKQVPYDSSQSTLLLTINKAPPQLIEQTPSLPFAPAFLNGSDSGQFSCLFRALELPEIRASLDGSAALFEQLRGHGVFRVRKEPRQAGFYLVELAYSPASLEHTGRLVLQAVNNYGVASCRMTLFAAVHPPTLKVREFEPRQLAVTDKPFDLHCNVLGGVNVKASTALELLRQAHPGLAVPTYSLHWQLLRGSGPPLVLPRDHRMLVNDRDWPDRLHVTSVEVPDAGQYTCEAQLSESRSAYPFTVAPSKSSTNVVVVHGISVSRLQDQLNLESSLAIADTCKPINSPTGRWLTWWTFRAEGEAHDRLLPDGAVTHTSASHPGASDYHYFDTGPHADIDQSEQCRSLQAHLQREAGLDNVYNRWNKSANLLLHPTNRQDPAERQKYQGEFICHIASCYDRKSAVKRVTLKREYVFQANMPPNSQEVVLGSPLTVHCAVENPGDPPPQIRWYQGNQRLDRLKIPMFQPHETQRVAQFPNATLVISRIEATDSNFLCDVNGSRSVTFNLNIRLPARVVEFPSPRIEVPAGSSRSVKCRVEGDWPHTVHWFGKFQASGNVNCNLSAETPYDHFSALGTAGAAATSCSKTLPPTLDGPAAQIRVAGDTLEFVAVSQGLRGLYTCLATNRFSRNASQQGFEMLVVEPPSTVRSLQLTDRGHESLTLQWEPPVSSGHKPILYYTIQYYGVDHRRVSLNVSEHDRKCVVGGLQPGFNYEFAVSAVNSVGAGPAERCQGATRERPPSGPVRGLRVRAVGSAGLELVWNEPDRMLKNGHITNYTVHYRDLSSSAGAPPDCPDDAGVAAGGGFQMALRCPSLRAVVGVGDSLAQCRNGGVALRAFTDYQVRVTPANAVGNGPAACAVARTLEATPRSPPRDVRCESKSRSQILVSWAEPDYGSVNGDVDMYHVQYMTAESFRTENELEAKDAQTKQRSLLIEELEPYTEYAFAVSVSNRWGRSPRALPPAVCRTLPAPPLAPTTPPRALGANASSAVIAWRRIVKPNGRLLAYELSVQRLNRSGDEPPRLLVRNATDRPRQHYERLLVTGLQPGGLYEFRVRGVSEGGGVGEFSEPVSLMMADRPPVRIVSFDSTFHVDRNSSLVLDCEIVGGDGQQKPDWKRPPVDPPPTEVLSNGSLLIRRLVHDGEFTCGVGQGAEASSVTYAVKAINRDAQPTPPVPQLLRGRSTASSLELRWRTGGRPAGAPDQAAISHFDLRYSRASGSEEWRTLAGANRSYLLDRVDCGASVDFKLRAVNGFDLKSGFADTPLRLTAVGSPPIVASDAARWLVARQHRHGLELNLTGLLPGDGCPPERYFVSLTPLRQPEAPQHSLIVRRADLAGPAGCCFNLTEPPLHNELNYRLTVLASNAAGNSTPVSKEFKARDLGVAGSGGDSGGVGVGGGVGGGGRNEELPSFNGPDPSGGISSGSSLILPIVVVTVVIVAVLVVVIVAAAFVKGVLGHDCITCFCSCCPGEAVKNAAAAADAEVAVSAAASAAATAQPFLAEPPGVALMKGGRKVTLQVAGRKALPVPPPPPLPHSEVLADGAILHHHHQQQQQLPQFEDDRASIDEDGNLVWYGIYHPSESAAAAAAAAHAAAAAAGATLRGTGSVGHLPPGLRQHHPHLQPARRGRHDPTEARRARDYHGVPTAAQLEQLRSYMSSSTTVSSTREELLEAYRIGKLQGGFPPLAPPPAVAEYDGSGSSGGSTDPGIRQFTCLPPGPNELRKFSCEVPYSAGDPGLGPSTSRRYRRQMSASTDRTYDKIDDSLGGGRRRRQLQLQHQHQLHQHQHQLQHQQFQPQQHRQRTSSDAGGSYGTGVYDSADGSGADYYSYNAALYQQQQQQQQQQQRRRLQGAGGVYSTYQRSYQQPPPVTPQHRLHRERVVAAVVHAPNIEDEDDEEDEEEEERQQSRQLLDPAGTVGSRRYYQPPPSGPHIAAAAAAASAAAPDSESADPTYEDFFTEV